MAGYARRMSFDTGLTRLPTRALASIASIAFAGEAAGLVADAFYRAGGPPPILESDHFAFSSRDAEQPSVSRVRDLATGSVDLIVLRRAWKSVDQVAEAIRISKDRVASGGEVIAADLDVNRLLAGPTLQYPGRLFYLAAPSSAARLRESTATPALLGAEAVRASLRPIDGITYDEVRSSHESVAELWESIRDRGWRGSAWTPHDEHGTVLESVASGLVGALPIGEVADREPWYAVIGTRP